MITRFTEKHATLYRTIVAALCLTMAFPSNVWATPSGGSGHEDGNQNDKPPTGGECSLYGGSGGIGDYGSGAYNDLFRNRGPASSNLGASGTVSTFPVLPAKPRPRGPASASTNMPIDLLRGAVIEKAVDVSLPGPNSSWQHLRTYDSRLVASDGSELADHNGKRWMTSALRPLPSQIGR